MACCRSETATRLRLQSDQTSKQPPAAVLLSGRAAVLLLLVHNAPPRLGGQQLLQPRNDLALRMRRGWSGDGPEKMRHPTSRRTRGTPHKPVHERHTPRQRMHASTRPRNPS